MSGIKVVDKRGGTYQAIIDFTYGECERLPFNILRRIRAKIATIPNGGIQAVASFNIRSPRDSAAFLEMLELFGEDGSFIHGSAAAADALACDKPPESNALDDADADDDDLEVEDFPDDGAKS